MAKKVTTLVELSDDIDGGKADRTVAFAFDGANYEIDLSKKNANAFEKAVRPYVEAARKSKPARGRSTPPKASSGRRTDLAAIREWAKSNGHEVSDRGRIPSAVVEAYDSAR
jgi:hypothetical protein